MTEISVPIHYIDLMTLDEKMVDLVGGCKGISIEDKYVYRPHFSYAIVDNKKATTKLLIDNFKKKKKKQNPMVVY